MMDSIRNAIKMIWTLAHRELISMFRVPAGWIIIAFFTFLSAVLFVNQTLVPGQPGSMRYFFAASTWLLIPIAPAISMRLMAEEYRTGSFESLRTTPAGDWTVALGKYIGSLLFLALMLTPSLCYPVVLAVVSNPAPDPGPIVAGYLMLMLVGSLYLAIGLLASSLTSSQTLAFLGTMMALVLFMVTTSVLAPHAGTTLAPILDRLSVITRAGELSKGVIDTSTIFFFVLGSAWMIALTAGVLESRRLARSKWSLGVMGTIFALSTGLCIVFAGVLTNDHRLRIDVTSTSAHKLSPRAKSMVDSLPGRTRIILAINEAETDRLARDLVSDVLDTYDRSSDQLSAQIIDLSSADGMGSISSLIQELRDRDAESIAQNASTKQQAAATLQSSAQTLESLSPNLLRIAELIDLSAQGGSTNKAFFTQRATLARLGSQDLIKAAGAIENETDSSIALINAQLIQTEDLINQLNAFAQAPEIAPALQAMTSSLLATTNPVVDELAILADKLARLPLIDADRVETALETGEALLVIGPQESGIAAVDLDALLPPTQVLEEAGISPAGVIGPRAQELIASALGQLVIQSHPIVIFVHAAGPGELLSGSALLTSGVSRLQQQGIDSLEWAALQETDQPSLAQLDPLGQRPVVYFVLAADSTTGGGDSGVTGARRATALAQIAGQLIDAGQSVLISMNPSIFGSFGDNDPLIAILEPFGIVPDPTKTLLTQRLSGAKRSADPATLIVPTLELDTQTHPVSQAISGLNMALPWAVPMQIDPRVGSRASPIITFSGSQDIWAEHDWLNLWSTPAQSRAFLRDQPSFDESVDLRRDQWILGAGSERTLGSETQRVIAVGSSAWLYDALTFSQGQLVDGRITTAFPGNLVMLESSIAWLSGLDQLIAPGVQSRPIATIRALDADELSRYRWILLGGVPCVIILIGIGTRFIFG